MRSFRHIAHRGSNACQRCCDQSANNLPKHSCLDFRDLLAALNFEASYAPTKRELTIRVTLVPELTTLNGGRALPFVRAPSGHYSNLPDLRFRAQRKNGFAGNS